MTTFEIPGFTVPPEASDAQLDSCDVWVLGGGISGLTTATVLQSLGLKVAILSDRVTLQNAKTPEHPHIPTGYAMATAYPHNLKVKNLLHVSDTTQSVFGTLAKMPQAGVAIYRMFEVYENEPTEAALAIRRMNFQTFEGTPDTLSKSLNPPTRPGAKYLWGWRFDTYFADMPKYLSFLWVRFFRNGGHFRKHHITLQDDFASTLFRLSVKPLINCLGLGAVKAVADGAPATIVRGKQAIALNMPMVCDVDGVPLAYNYTPTADVFARGDGLPEYVHFFSRSDGWILGQTREPGIVNDAGDWVGTAVASGEITIGDISIPTPIIELNDTILRNWVNQTIDRNTLTAREGLRYYRDPENTGVRLEGESAGEIQLVHNYGHGGSGITMSWGCALEAARILLALSQTQPCANATEHDELHSQLLHGFKNLIPAS